MKNCGHCHTCGTKLRTVLDGEEWCDRCGQYRRYQSHGWQAPHPWVLVKEGTKPECPDPTLVAEAQAKGAA